MEDTSIVREKYKRSERVNEYFTYFVLISGLLIVQLPLPFEIDKKGIYIVVSAFLLFMIVWHRLIPEKYTGLTKNFTESAIDILGLFAVVALTGGVRSYFTFLYLLPILSSAVYMPLRATVALATLASVLIFSQAFFSFGEESFPSILSISVLQVWAIWLISAYGRYLVGEIQVTKKSEEEIKIEEVREIEKLKDEFIFIISHELRTPITVIRGYLELLIDGAVGKIDSNSKAVLEKAFSTSSNLSNLVSILLEAARLETGRISFIIQDNFMEKSLERVKYNFDGEIRRKNLDLDIKVPKTLKVKVDIERLEEILNIIVGNAVRYTPEFGKIEISAKEKSGQVSLVISDNGLGMTQERKDRLFEKLYTERTGLGDKVIKGINIGMYVVKQLLLKMDGDIDVETKVGEGTKFTILLPSSKDVPVKAIVFDAGGVLFNSAESLFSEPIKYVAKISGKPRKVVDEAYREVIREIESREVDKESFWNLLTTKLGVAISYSVQDPIAEGFKKFKKDTGVLGIVSRLKPKYKVALVSNANAIEAATKEVSSIYREFDEVVLSFKIGVRKPHPKIYQTIFDRLKVKPEETVFIDNSPTNIEEAKKLGMKAILFKNVNQLRSELAKVGVDIKV